MSKCHIVGNLMPWLIRFCSHCRISLRGTKKLVKRIGDLESQQSNSKRQVKELKELVHVSKKPEENGSNHEINI